MMNAGIRYAMRFMQSFRFRCRCGGFYGTSRGWFREQQPVQKSHKDSRTAGATNDRVQLAAHNRSDPEDDFDEVAVAFPEVVAVEVEDGIVPFRPVVFGSVVFALVGAEELTARLARNTFNALSSCPRPVFPSYSLFVQCVPQAVPLSPPEHCLAAPSAEL